MINQAVISAEKENKAASGDRELDDGDCCGEVAIFYRVAREASLTTLNKDMNQVRN